MTLEYKEHRTFGREDYEPYIGKSGNANKGLQPLPNAKLVDPLNLLQDIASGGHMMQPVWGYALLPDGSRQQWTQFFLTSYMMSGCDGGGYAVTYGSGGVPICRRFYICQHSKEEGPGAIPSRGWHPGKCVKCGFNMTYDSGD
jgi:hypothetical protein